MTGVPPYRGTSLIRNTPPAGPCSSPMPVNLWRTQGAWLVAYERGIPVPGNMTSHASLEERDSTRWVTTLASEVDLHHTTIFRAIRSAKLFLTWCKIVHVTLNILGSKTLVLHRVVQGANRRQALCRPRARRLPHCRRGFPGAKPSTLIQSPPCFGGEVSKDLSLAPWT